MFMVHTLMTVIRQSLLTILSLIFFDHYVPKSFINAFKAFEHRSQPSWLSQLQVNVNYSSDSRDVSCSISTYFQYPR